MNGVNVLMFRAINRNAMKSVVIIGGTVVCMIGVIFFLMKGCVHVKVCVKQRYVPNEVNPLEYMVTRVPLEEFERAIRERPDLISYKPSDRPDDENMSILSGCAIILHTNHIKVLLKYGADIDEAINWHAKYGTKEALALLQQMKAEQAGKVDSSHFAESARTNTLRVNHGSPPPNPTSGGGK